MGSYRQRLCRQIGSVIFLAILVGCAKSNQSIVTDTNSMPSESYQYVTQTYSVIIPSDFANKQKQASSAFFGYALTSKTGDVLVSVHDSAPSCAPVAIGIGFPEDMQVPGAENTIFGRMDSREIYWTMDFPIEFTDICGPQTGEAIYAFCSEKVGDPASAADDKRVLICISQQTDDPKMAEEIFKTFRWTE